MKFTLRDLQERFPTEESVLLDILARQERVCVCGKNQWYPVTGRKAFACSCGHQVYPLKGTIFENSTTDLRTWYYVMWRLSTSKSGVAAAQIQRETGLTYKAAWRMCHKIRELMHDDSQVEGVVEADETFFKAKPWRHTRVKQDPVFNYPAVLAVIERPSGRVRVRVIESVKRSVIHPAVKAMVVPGSVLRTDGSFAYRRLDDTYTHVQKTHWGPKSGTMSFRYIPIAGDSTQAAENFFSQLKRGIYGVYRYVSKQHLQKYADEFAWRYSRRRSESLFDLLLQQV